MSSPTSHRLATWALVAALGMSLTACLSFNFKCPKGGAYGSDCCEAACDDGGGAAAAATSDDGADCPPGLQPPSSSGGLPTLDMVSLMPSNYSTGGIMINVDVVEHSDSSISNDATIRVLTDVGELDTTSGVPDFSDAPLRSAVNVDLTSGRWAGSSLQRFNSAVHTHVHAIVQVTLDGETPFYRVYQWELATLSQTWVTAVDETF